MGARWLKPVLIASSLAELSTTIAGTIGLLGFRYFIYRGRFPQSSRSGAEEVRANPRSSSAKLRWAVRH